MIFFLVITLKTLLFLNIQYLKGISIDEKYEVDVYYDNTESSIITNSEFINKVNETVKEYLTNMEKKKESEKSGTSIMNDSNLINNMHEALNDNEISVKDEVSTTNNLKHVKKVEPLKTKGLNSNFASELLKNISLLKINLNDKITDLNKFLESKVEVEISKNVLNELNNSKTKDISNNLDKKNNQDNKANPIQDNKANPIQDNKSNPIQDNKSNPIQDNKSNPIQDNKSNVIQDNKANPIQDNKSNPIQDNKANPIQDNKSNPIQDKNNQENKTNIKTTPSVPNYKKKLKARKNKKHENKLIKDFDKVKSDFTLLLAIKEFGTETNPIDLDKESYVIDNVSIYFDHKKQKYYDYWGAIEFKNINNKFVDKSGFLRGNLKKDISDLIKTSKLSRTGLWLDKNISKFEDLKNEYKFKMILLKIAENRKKSVESFFNKSDQINLVDKLIFIQNYPLKPTDILKVCVCKNNICKNNECKDIKNVLRKNLF